MIIGITGTDGAGKGSVVDYLVREKGFAHYSSRSLITEEIERQGLQATREQLRLTGNDMRKQHGHDVIVQAALKKIAAAGEEHTIIESIRAVAEAETLQANGGILLAVDADQHIRFERISARGSATDQITFEQFQAEEALEMNDPDPHGMQKAKVMEMADYTISNSTSIEDLERAIEVFLKQHT